MKRFSRKTSQQLKHYVYALVDPRTEEIFYVGKGSGSTRPFSHLDTRNSAVESEKAGRIMELVSASIKPRIDILRHGLDEQTAHEIEAAVIDTIGMHKLTNRNTGHYSPERGRLTAGQVEARLGGAPLDVSDVHHPAILFYRREACPQNRLYDETRQFWALNEDRIRAHNPDGTLKYQLAFAMRGNFVLEVYRILQWFEAGTTISSRAYQHQDGRKRWEFIGATAEEPVRRKYHNKSLMRDGAPLHATQIGFRYLA
jgi:hypothetical protein